MEVLKINGHDYSRFIAAKGCGWSREDLDSEKTKRTKDGKLRRDKIATKRKLSYKMLGMTREKLAQLDDDLSSPTFSATYFDLHGVSTRTFYCSSFTAALDAAYDQDGMWSGATFSIIEV